MCGFLSLAAADSPAQSAPKSPIPCFCLHKAKNLLIRTGVICFAKEEFNIHSYPGLHMCISSPGEAEEFYILKVVIVSCFWFITYKAEKATYFQVIKYMNSSWEFHLLCYKNLCTHQTVNKNFWARFLLIYSLMRFSWAININAIIMAFHIVFPCSQVSMNSVLP